MNKKSHAASLAISAILFVAFFPPITNATGPSQVTKSHICKAGVATVMGRDPSIMRIDTEVGGVLYLSYVRADDGSLWSNKCKVDGNLIIWASNTGRWRNHPADPRLSYRIQAEIIYVEEKYSDGSATKKSFKLDQLKE